MPHFYLSLFRKNIMTIISNLQNINSIEDLKEIGASHIQVLKEKSISIDYHELAYSLIDYLNISDEWQEGIILSELIDYLKSVN